MDDFKNPWYNCRYVKLFYYKFFYHLSDLILLVHIIQYRKLRLLHLDYSVLVYSITLPTPVYWSVKEILSLWENYARWKCFSWRCRITCGQAQYGDVFPESRFIVLYSQRGEEEEIPNRQDLRGTPVSIAEQIYLLCGQQPPHCFLASILVPLFLKYWLTLGLESYLTNESMYGRWGREEGRSLRVAGL